MIKIEKEKFNNLSLKEQIDVLHTSPVMFWICWDNPTPDLLILDYNSKGEIQIKSRLKQVWFKIDKFECSGNGEFIAHSKDCSFSFIPYIASKAYL